MAGACRTERTPWKTTIVIDEKLRFALEYDTREQTVTELCKTLRDHARDRAWITGACGLQPRIVRGFQRLVPHHGERIHVSTVSDAHRRYLLRCQVVENTD